MAEHEIICARGCGFRGPDDYFQRKTRFAVGLCPRCNGPVRLVEALSDTPVPGVVKWDLAGPKQGRYTIQPSLPV